MNSKRKIIIVIGLAALFIALISTASSFGGKKITEPTLRERQVEFLKENKSVMIGYLKKQDHNILKVKFDWVDVGTIEVGNGTPQGGGELLTVKTHIIDGKNKEYDSFGLELNLIT